MTTTHELPEGYILHVASSSGDVTVIAEERADVEISDTARAELRTGENDPEDERPRERRRSRRHKGPVKAILQAVLGGPVHKHHGHERGPALEVRSRRGGSQNIEVRCPAGTSVAVGTISGNVDLRGRFGPARLATASGDIRVEEAESVDARSISGDLEVGSCDGSCRLTTKSGHIEAGKTGAAQADTVSGHVHLDRTAGAVTVRTVSGNIEVGTDGSDAVKVRSVSGGVNVKIAGDRLPDPHLRSLSGKVECDCPTGSDFPLEVTTVSGKIDVEPT
ncbi:MAG: DUF4097 family beta strand repeat-containing protein [Dehalococcoidia bacterium]